MGVKTYALESSEPPATIGGTSGAIVPATRLPIGDKGLLTSRFLTRMFEIGSRLANETAVENVITIGSVEPSNVSVPVVPLADAIEMTAGGPGDCERLGNAKN